jgi:hypothetical protein
MNEEQEALEHCPYYGQLFLLNFRFRHPRVALLSFGRPCFGQLSFWNFFS